MLVCFQVQNDTYSIAYRLFKRRIVQRNRSGAPAASTPLPTGGRYSSSVMLDTVRQRLWMDSPPRHRPDAPPVQCQSEDNAQTGVVPPFDRAAHTSPWHRPRHRDNAVETMMVWRPVEEEHAETSCPGSSGDPQPFSSLSVQSESQKSLFAPSLLDDYYTNLLDCSCYGVVALALGSSVYFWNSETCVLVGRLAPKLSTSPHSQTILSLLWSSDGKELCVGNRRGDIELWDVERGLSVTRLPSHQSAVRALSWKHNLVSSGSDLGHIQHYDPRAGAAVGKASQQGAVCSLQWSEDDQLASGSTEGLLHVWDRHIHTQLQEPATAMRQRTSVKAMHWCPWQKNTIATGGGWKDGEVRIWDTKSGTCLTSVQTNSQICCLRWTEKTRRLVTGHGAPRHHISSWLWNSPDLTPTHHFSGHSRRVLHLCVNSDGSQMFTAGADQSVQVWGM